MDTLISKAKMIPGLGWRLWQSIAFSFFAALFATFILWIEDMRLSQLVYGVPVLVSVTVTLVPWFFVYSLYYEGRRKKWLTNQVQG